jgi:hypothetical protein
MPQRHRNYNIFVNYQVEAVTASARRGAIAYEWAQTLRSTYHQKIVRDIQFLVR